MRARQPDQAGYAVNNGVRLYYEVAGDGEQALLFVPAFQIAHSRAWKMQVPVLAHHYRTIVYDPRGNGKSDRPATDYGIDALVGDALAVLDHLGVERCGLVTVSAGTQTCLHLAARYPERISGIVIIGGGISAGGGVTPERAGRLKAMRADYDAYVRDFWDSIFVEPHSTKPKDDGWEWAHETNADVLAAAVEYGWALVDSQDAAERVRCPVLILHGTDDRLTPYHMGRAMHERLPQARMVTFDASGHLPNVRDPVRVNLLVSEFFTVPGPREATWRRAPARPRRALFISSPIGLGHIQRDLAVARELRALVPDLEIHWWAQHPVTRVLEEAGETIHPQSRLQASESAHWEDESSRHELHAFYAFRRMDEILLHNFMLFHDATRETPYDLWIGDESWEIDYYLHENPELKTAPYVFMTDVIGFLPVDPDRDPREAELCADYNAEMIEHRARFPRLRDLSLYVGEYEELPDAPFGPDLPRIREWARQWFEPVGYILPFDPFAYHDARALRERLDYGSGYPLLFATAGGTGVGRDLLRRVAEAVPLLREAAPEARMVMVTGPRINPEDLPSAEGLEKRPYVHDLFEHLACADAAVIQGGLSTTMELVAARRPFIYFPLQKHWEQVHHVPYRLDHYGAGIRMNYAETSPEDLARAMARALASEVRYRPVAPGAARRAAGRIATLL